MWASIAHAREEPATRGTLDPTAEDGLIASYATYCESSYAEFFGCLRKGLRRTAPDGRRLDGRNRLKACQKLGVDPWFKTVDPDNPVAYVVSANYQRRHLSKAQRAAIAVRSSWDAEAKKSKLRQGWRKPKAPDDDPVHVQELVPEGGLTRYANEQTRDRLASSFDVNPKYIDTAKTLHSNRSEADRTLRELLGSLPETQLANSRIACDSIAPDSGDPDAKCG